MPTMRGPSIMLDVGANVHPKAEHLFQYGVMGEIFARHMLKKDKPTIGLMNVGAEQGKGNDLVRLTQQLFSQCDLQGSFIGNIEGRDIHRGVADVSVTDGFVGNVVLKVCEGLFEFMMKMVGKEVVGVLDQEKDKAMAALHKLVHTYDYSEYGGAPLLGIDGICIICHGSSGERAIKNALSLAARLARAGINKLIVEELERMPQLNSAATNQG
jgi:glycerol-3-phosphate acyltransferase PlsX